MKISPKERYGREYSKLKDLYTEKLYQGYDLSEAEDVAKDAKEAYNMGDYESAMKFLDEAIIALERAKKVTPVMLPVIWTEGEYMNYLIQNTVAPVIPPLTKEQMQLVINDERFKQKSLKGLKVALEYYDEKRDKNAKSGLLRGEKERAFETIDNITSAITQLKRDINMKKKNIDVIYEDYNKFRSSVIQEYQLRQELRKKFEPMYDAFIHRYEPEIYHSVKFGILSESASLGSYYVSNETDTLEYILKEIDMLSETGADHIIIWINYQFWIDQDDDPSNGIQQDYESIHKIDRAVERIRKNNKKVYFCLGGVGRWYNGFPRGDPRYVGNGNVDFETWKRMYLGSEDQPGMVETIVRRYDPDYVAIVEPTVEMAAQVRGIRPASDWIEVTRRAADIVKEISPDRVVVVHNIMRREPPDLEFFEGVTNIENVDVIGFDVFGLAGFPTIEETFLPYLEGKEKEFWIAEAWNDVNGKYLDRLDDKYIIASVYYAQYANMTGYNIIYGRHVHTRDFEKTPAFFAYKDVIEEVRSNAK